MARSGPQFPYLPLWVDDFAADTTHLSIAETGAYLMLLMAAWRSSQCALPDDQQALARMARCSGPRWAKLRPRVMSFWQLGADGLWRQKRLTLEREKSFELFANRSHTARANALKRYNTGAAAGMPLADHPHTISESISIIHNSESSVAARGAAPADSAAPRAPGPTSRETWQQRLADYDPQQIRKTWSMFWGPRPDQAGTQPAIPPDLLAEWRSQQRKSA